jgi:hypothetical protein
VHSRKDCEPQLPRQLHSHVTTSERGNTNTSREGNKGPRRLINLTPHFYSTGAASLPQNR